MCFYQKRTTNFMKIWAERKCYMASLRVARCLIYLLNAYLFWILASTRGWNMHAFIYLSTSICFWFYNRLILLYFKLMVSFHAAVCVIKDLVLGNSLFLESVWSCKAVEHWVIWMKKLNELIILWRRESHSLSPHGQCSLMHTAWITVMVNSFCDGAANLGLAT